jgi:endonuclease/exonuclease/phosphatase family metal-dependent hydrolase
MKAILSVPQNKEETMIRKLVSLLVVLVLLSAGVQSVSASTPEQLNVMTRNMDAGSDFWYVLTADPNNPSAILVAITQTYQEMLASNIALRADGIAAEIQRQHPNMVALQEVTTLSSGPYGATELTVVVSGLDSLMTALGNRGLHYKAILVQKNAEISLPALDATYQNLIQVGLTDYDAVLVRADLPAAELKVVGKQAGHFSAAATLNFTVAGQSIPFLRGWIAVDVKVRGKNYRLVTTHLETFSPDYQAAQTNELLNGPLSTDLPLILAGDLNSDAHAPSWESGPAYGILTSAGFVDIWSEIHPNDAGITWPLFLEDSGIGPSTPQRIDLILSKGSGIAPLRIVRTGLSPRNGLWSSDHAGVAAAFRLRP